MKILYIGPLWKGSTTLQRADAMELLGHEVVLIDTASGPIMREKRKLMNRIKRRFLGPSDVGNINEEIVKRARRGDFDVLWVDKGLTVEPESIRAFKRYSPGGKAIAYSPDDMMNPHNRSRQYVECIPEYDLHITTKSFNVEELKSQWAKDVLFVDNAYCPKIHRPVEVSEEERKLFGGLVGFVGFYEKERARSIAFLAKNGIKVKVWGPWPKLRVLEERLKGVRVMGMPLLGDDYAKAISSFQINLVFLRKCNRDLQTTRSVEIPACGGFMLAERTDEHLSLFEEGFEAEFFGSDKELADKVRYYLANPEKRKKIAEAGYRRCINSRYSNRDRLSKVMEYLEI